MDNDLDLQEMQAYVALQSKSVQENSEIVTPADMGTLHSLHIDKNVPPAFEPRMPKSAMDSENDTCARITVATTLLGCYIGYFRGETDLAAGSVKKADDSDQFLGGYVISKLAFTHALKPNKELVPDADRSEELWLVSYNQSTLSYVPIKIGKMFVHRLTYIPVNGQEPDIEAIIFIENTDTLGMWLDRKNKIGVGYYSVTIKWPNQFDRSIYNPDLTIIKVTKDEYEKTKGLQATMLEYKEPPKYIDWK